jgi:hypothetical protein
MLDSCTMKKLRKCMDSSTAVRAQDKVTSASACGCQALHNVRNLEPLPEMFVPMNTRDWFLLTA